MWNDQNSPESLPAETPASVRTTLIWMAAAVLLGGAAVSTWMNTRWQMRGPSVVRYKWNLVRHAEGPVDWLILGDSAGLRGFDTGLLRRDRGARALNLCLYETSGIYQMAWILDYFLSLHPPPSRVVIVNHVTTWSMTRFNEEWANLPVDWRRWLTLDPSPFFPPVMPPHELVEVFFRRLVPAAMSVEGVRRWRERGRSGTEDGFEGRPREGPPPAGGFRSPDYAADAYAPSPRALRALGKIAALAEARGFEVVIVNPPLRRRFAETPAFQKNFPLLRDRLRAVCAASPRLRYVEELVLLEDADFLDHDHVHADGASDYTRRVLALIEP